MVNVLFYRSYEDPEKYDGIKRLWLVQINGHVIEIKGRFFPNSKRSPDLLIVCANFHIGGNRRGIYDYPFDNPDDEPAVTAMLKRVYELLTAINDG